MIIAHIFVSRGLCRCWSLIMSFVLMRQLIKLVSFCVFIGIFKGGAFVVMFVVLVLAKVGEGG